MIMITNYSVRDTGILGKKSACSYQELSSDALPLSYRRLVGANYKAIKPGSLDKHSAYWWDWNVMCGICAMEQT